MKRIRSLIAATSGMALMAGAAWAQDIGQPAQGRVLAQQICSECHSIEKTVLGRQTLPRRDSKSLRTRLE